jgi:Adenylate and Guanylate cyclase catalytic domain
MFADLVGFTVLSSVREPTQVFILLETLFGELDKIAKRRRIFKVETVGDCYVAVAGPPDPRPDHAVAMARFAPDCVWSAMKLPRRWNSHWDLTLLICACDSVFILDPLQPGCFVVREVASNSSETRK